MFNPLVDSFSDLTDNEIEEKIAELSRKYFMSTNPHLAQQISTILEMYKDEIRSRRAQQKIQQQNDQNDLDNLIKVS